MVAIKDDESRSRLDYETNETYGGNKGDESRSRRDYETNEMYGGNKWEMNLEAVEIMKQMKCMVVINGRRISQS